MADVEYEADKGGCCNSRFKNLCSNAIVFLIIQKGIVGSTLEYIEDAWFF